jgi:tetratricopeptide (TPR) repeat protein
LFKKAWDYEAEGVDKGRVLMNMGVNRKRRGMFKDAERYYKKALEIFEAEDAIQKCDIYNNMAELYKVTGNYGKAMEYILKALIYLDSRDVQRYFVYFHTYIEIKILKGEVSQYLEILIALLSNVQRYFVHKCFIVEGFNTACSIIPEEKSVLKHLRQELAEAIETTACDNEDYKNELVKCLADVCLSLKLLKSY